MNAPENNYLLRIEGVNLSNVLDDTSEISIRRGASLMLRKAVTNITREIPNLKSISTGASIGLYTLNDSSPESIKNSVVDHLNNTYPFLTFVVDIEAYSQKTFKQSHEKLIAKNRFRQFQQITIHTPNEVNTPSVNTCCEMNQLHPIDADPEIVKGKHVSASSRERFNKGRLLRQTFYQEELNLSAHENYDFTDDLTALSNPNSKTQNYSNLNDKVAVIYLDGNSFGKLQKSCKTPDELQDFDTINQSYRKRFLKDFIEKANSDTDMQHGDKIRLETLLWGGDEMILVVPAWKGMEALQYFYNYSKDWSYKENKLSYAGGIVFCHHKTPISQIIKAAQDLAETVKETNDGRDNDYFNYLVLESVDYPTQAINKFWSLRYGTQTRNHITPLMPTAFPDNLSSTLESLPRGSIYDIGQHWVNHWKSNSPQNDTQLEERIKRFIEVDAISYQLLFESIFPLLTLTPPDRGENQQHLNSGWLHLVELWDYLAPANSKHSNKSKDTEDKQ